MKCCFTSTETVGVLGTGAQDVHLDFHTAPEFGSAVNYPWKFICGAYKSPNENLRVHSARCTQCVPVGSYKLKLPNTFKLIKYTPPHPHPPSHSTLPNQESTTTRISTCRVKNNKRRVKHKPKKAVYLWQCTPFTETPARDHTTRSQIAPSSQRPSSLLIGCCSTFCLICR